MRIKSVRIKNYRAIKDLELQFDKHTALIGPNGAGKSTVLHALNLFYAPGNPNPSSEDFFNKDTQQEIDISITFTGFTNQDRELFDSRITENGDMLVSRVFSSGAGRNNGKYYGVTLLNPDFAEIRNQDGARAKIAAYGEFRQRQGYEDLPAARSGQAVDDALAGWERDHRDRCQLGRDDGQFFGFTNVASGKLHAATRFVYVPAVRDASDDALESRGSAITQLLDLVVRSAISAKPELQAFQAEIQQRYQELTDPANLAELGGLATRLSETLRTFYDQCAVQLNWRQADPLSIPLPAADMRLVDGGYDTTVDRTGNGLQRALILTLLQHLAITTNAAPAAEGEGERAPPQVPGLVLAIEEPELYQHPTKQRHFANVLNRLSTGQIRGVADNTQVLICTHSNFFVSISQFDGIRIMRKQPAVAPEPMIAHCSVTTLDSVAGTLAVANGLDRAAFNAETLRPRLHIMDKGLNEGFFSASVVLVEGASDKAALAAAARLSGRNFEESEISLIAADGKTNMDRPYAIFTAFNIPVYAMWDNDQGGDQPAVVTNRALQRLAGVGAAAIEDYPERVEPNYACFTRNLEVTLKREIGEDLFDRLLDAAVARYAIRRRRDAQKIPAVMEEILSAAAQQGHQSATLGRIVDAIFAVRAAH